MDKPGVRPCRARPRQPWRERLLPRIHGTTDCRQQLAQYLMLLLGMATIGLIRLQHG